MLKLIIYSIKKGILMASIKLVINLSIIYIINQTLYLLIIGDLNLLDLMNRLVPQSYDHDLYRYLLINILIYLGAFVLILVIYRVLEKLFITVTLYQSINKLLIFVFVVNLILPIILNWSNLERSINQYSYSNELFMILNAIFIHFLVSNLLFNVLRSLHRKLLKDLLEYPTLRKGVTIRLLEHVTIKRQRIEAQKKIRQQLEQKYLDDLKNLNSNR
jgi:hypothetical protein